MYFFDTLDP